MTHSRPTASPLLWACLWVALSLTGCGLKDQLTLPAEAPSIGEPHRGTLWEEGDLAWVSWRPLDPPGTRYVDLDLLYGDSSAPEVMPIARRVRDNGAFQWPCRLPAPRVGQSEDSLLRCRLKISWSSGEGLISEMFRIQPRRCPCVLEVTQPDSGEIHHPGDVVSLRWRQTGWCGSRVQIGLESSATTVTLADSALATGAWLWNIPWHLPTGTYAFTITDLRSGARVTSPAFTVEDAAPRPCSLRVISPNGGECLQAGEACRIRWEAAGECPGLVRIDLLRGEDLCLTIAEATLNTGRYTWFAEGCGTGNDYRIRIAAEGVSGDVSDSTFTIVDPGSADCRILPLWPSSGDTLLVGSTVEVLWDTTGTCGPTVRIDLLRDSEPCTTLARAAENSGSFPWLVGISCGEGTYTLRFTDNLTNVPSESQPFAISYACSLQVLAPSPGEVWMEGSNQQITWSCWGLCPQSLDLDLLLAGTPCFRIGSSIPNTGSFEWTVEGCGNAESGYSVRISSGDTILATSPGTFTILKPCSVDLLFPVGGEELIAGSPVRISWDRSNACGSQVRIDLLRNGTFCRCIAQAAENCGHLYWVASQCGGNSTGYRIQVTDLSSSAKAISGSTFRIVAPAMITVLPTDGILAASTNCGSLAAVEASGTRASVTAPPAWAQCLTGQCIALEGLGSSIVLTDPSSDGFFIDPSCTGLSVSIEGMAQEATGPIAVDLLARGTLRATTMLHVPSHCSISSCRIPPSEIPLGIPVELHIHTPPDAIDPLPVAASRIQVTFDGWVATP